MLEFWPGWIGYFPHKDYSLTRPLLVQSERITFRAVLNFSELLFLRCSEYDTFLKDYITGKSIPIPQTGNCAQKTAPSGFSPDSAVLSVSRNCVLTCMAAILAVLNSYLFMQDQQRMPSSIIHSTKSDASSDVKCFFRELPAGEYTVSFSMVKKDFLTDESAVSPLNTAFPLDISHSPAFFFSLRCGAPRSIIQDIVEKSNEISICC